MDYTKNALKGVATGLVIVGLASAFFALAAQVKSPVLGNAGSRAIRLYQSASASTSPTFFRGDVSGINSSATSTLLTVGCDSTNTNMLSAPNNLQDIDTLGLYLQITATTSGNPTVYMQPEVSNDCIDWYGTSVPDQVTTAGTAVSNISVPSATTTSYFVFTVANKPTSQIVKQQITMRNLAAKAIRFKVWTGVASSSLWMQAAAAERITR